MKKYTFIFILLGMVVSPKLHAQYLGGPGDGFSFNSTKTNIAFPVEWVTFEATLAAKQINLMWITGQEVNSDYFIVEKSTDGVLFERITTVAASGNSDEPIVYRAIDKNLSLHIIYYRIKQVDQNGQFSYSQVEILNPLSDDWNAAIYSSPGNGTSLSLKFSGTQNETPITLTLRDVLGKRIGSHSFKTENDAVFRYEKQFNSPLRAGVYLVQITNLGNGQTKVLQWVVK